MQDACETYGSYGLYVIGQSRSTTNAWAKNKWETDGRTLLHNFYGDINGTVWNTYGYAGGIPFKVLIDRDGNIRQNGNWMSNFITTIKECCGAP